MYNASNFVNEQFNVPFTVKSIIKENEDFIMLNSNNCSIPTQEGYSNYLIDEYEEDQIAMQKMNEVKLTPDDFKILIMKKKMLKKNFDGSFDYTNTISNLDDKVPKFSDGQVTESQTLKQQKEFNKNLFSIKTGPVYNNAFKSKYNGVKNSVDILLNSKRNLKTSNKEKTCEATKSDIESEIDVEELLNQGLPKNIALLAKHHKKLKVTMDLLNRYRFYKRFCNSNYYEAFA